MEIIKEIKWEILTHAMSVSASLFVASKYSALPANHFTNLETLLMSVKLVVYQHLLIVNSGMSTMWDLPSAWP